MKFVLLLFCTGAFVGCATTAYQTEALLISAPADIPTKYEIQNVPFVEQAAGHCGPATLSMVMNWNAHPVSVDELVPQVYTPGMKGSFQTDMISAARRQGMMAVQIQGLNSLLSEIAAGHPVIVFENLALTWAPRYHYAVVYGYDLHEQIAIMHSGPEKGKRWDLRKFERSWMLGDYWGLVVLPPGQLSRTGSELAQASAAAGLESLGKDQAAEKSYKAILQRWPESLPALIGMGNIAFKQKNFKNSVEYLQRAIKAHPDSSAAQNNLAVAQKEFNKNKKTK